MGVTLANYWRGLYELCVLSELILPAAVAEGYAKSSLWATPAPNMPLTKYIMDECYADDEDEDDEEEDDGAPLTRFQKECSTNLAMLDIYHERICEDIPYVFSVTRIVIKPHRCTFHHRFSNKALKWELPLNVGDLEATIHLTEPELAAEVADELEFDGPSYGQPLMGFDRREHWGLGHTRPTDDTNRRFWESSAPVVEF